MCLTNLLYIGDRVIRSSTGKIIKPMTQHVDLFQKMTRDRIVRKAFYKFLHPYEVDEICNGFRRSHGGPEATDEDFMSYDQPEHKVDRDQHYRKALRKVAEAFRPPEKFKPVHYTDQRYYPWELAVSAESPYNIGQWYDDYLKRLQRELPPGEKFTYAKTFHNFYDKIFVDNRLNIHKIKDRHPDFFDAATGLPKPYYWTNLRSRFHVVKADEPDKIRAVFGVPKLLLQAEQTFIWPMLSHYLDNSDRYPLLWGNEMMSGGWRKLNRTIYNGRTVNTVLSLDWSQFDKRALHEVIDDVHDIWRSYFDFSFYMPTSFYPNAPTDESRLENLWEWMTYNIKKYPIRLSSGKLSQWRFNGIASGFQQTQLLDSFVNMIMILTCLSRAGVNINSKDFFISSRGRFTYRTFPEMMYQLHGMKFLDMIANNAMYYFNAKLNVDKSEINWNTNGMKVLGYPNDYGTPRRTDQDLLSHLFFPERIYSLPSLASTCIGIAYASCGSNPKVYAICQDIFLFLRNVFDVAPDVVTNRWMFRAGLLNYDEFTSMTFNSFPSMLELQARTLGQPTRSLATRERLWPTLPESKNGFHFLCKP
uniref:Putative RNA-dependent RNA polymerase n=1 Tax=Flammulina velutipes isometric virus TaxID=511616 RepID=B7X9J3_9VIRU|nr:putative RNA-dependent RNA polymerase [Flammulina velutipes isometric virus]